MSLTEEQKQSGRIAIAKDVLYNIENNENFTPKSLVYLYGIINGVDELNGSEQVQKYIDNIKCEVCALGACMLSFVKLYNNVTFNECHLVVNDKWLEQKNQNLDCNYHSGYEITVDDNFIRDKLSEYFDREQLDMIESAFECKPFINGRFILDSYPHLYEHLKPSIKFGQKYRYDEERMRVIMQNIVDSNGTFIPPNIED